MIKIVVIENHDWLRNGLCDLLSKHKDFKVVGSGTDGYDALNFAEEARPNIIVVRLDLPLISGLKLVKSIKIRSPRTAVILIGEIATDNDVIDFVVSGAEGFVLQNVVCDEICAAVRRIIIDKCYFLSQEIASKIMNLYSKQLKKIHVGTAELLVSQTPNIRVLTITKTEMQIACCIGEGLTNREIAQRINMSEGTVRNHVSSILQKGGFTHRTQIAIHVNGNGFKARDGRIKDVFNFENIQVVHKSKTKALRKTVGHLSVSKNFCF